MRYRAMAAAAASSLVLLCCAFAALASITPGNQYREPVYHPPKGGAGGGAANPNPHVRAPPVLQQQRPAGTAAPEPIPHYDPNTGHGQVPAHEPGHNVEHDTSTLHLMDDSPALGMVRTDGLTDG